MKAFQLIAHGSPGRFEIRDVPDPQLGPDEVVVNVRACGLNHLDLWLEEEGLPVPVSLPRTPGGEVSGAIEGIGSAVTNWKPGDRVAVQSNIFCGKCEFCQRGDESICLYSQLLGIQIDGGFAEKVVVPARVLARLPDNVSYIDSAALTLAGSTAMHMLTRRATVKPGDWVLVIGANSGVGSNAIQIAKGLGAQVITTGSNDSKRQLGLRLGADYVVDSTTDWASEVRKITKKRGVDVVVEHVGGPVLLQAFTCLARGGTIVTCGATAGREVPLQLWGLFVREQKLVGSYGRSHADVIATLDWASKGKLKPAIDRVFPLQEAQKAFELMRARQIMGKAVITPS